MEIFLLVIKFLKLGLFFKVCFIVFWIVVFFCLIEAFLGSFSMMGILCMFLLVFFKFKFILFFLFLLIFKERVFLLVSVDWRCELK